MSYLGYKTKLIENTSDHRHCEFLFKKDDEKAEDNAA